MLEIMLVVWAWRKGWKGFALLPLVTSVFLGFMWYALGGFDLGLGNFIFDLIAIIMLIVMVTNPRKTQVEVITTTADSTQPIVVNKAEIPVNVQPPIRTALTTAPDTSEVDKNVSPNKD